MAMVMLSTMFMLVKLAGRHGVSAAEMVFWRQAMSVPLIAGWLLATGRIGQLKTRRVSSHAFRATSGTLGLVCNVTAAMLLPLPVGTTLGFTAPLFAVLITAIVVRDKVGPWRWLAVVLGFAGVLVITRPGGETGALPLAGLAAGLGAGVIVAVVSFQIRDLARTEAPIACVFWFAFFGSLFAAVLLPFYGQSHEPRVWMLLVAVGLAGTLAQLLITAALRHGAVATVVVMDYTALIWATAYGYTIFGDLPPASTWLGAPLIIAAGLIITWREHYLSKRISPTSSLDESAIEETVPTAR
ncbi:DMT family transporter [Novosphingobium sp. ST904]|nr:DMT family transporter [Novosphingobium sp. ST904]KPH58739.1 transporter [Novosphingobium sp. ST904]TCM42241.1 EamA domain-containing membrane protein RarD [Novosphingobium sp. ST904]